MEKYLLCCVDGEASAAPVSKTISVSRCSFIFDSKPEARNHATFLNDYWFFYGLYDKTSEVFCYYTEEDEPLQFIDKSLYLSEFEKWLRNIISIRQEPYIQKGYIQHVPYWTIERFKDFDIHQLTTFATNKAQYFVVAPDSSSDLVIVARFNISLEDAQLALQSHWP